MVIGIGTGRCGTSSLSEWLGLPHEVKPVATANWGEQDIVRRKKKLTRHGGDVGFFYVNILPQILNEWDATVICLMRDKDETVESFLQHPDVSLFEQAFPQHDFRTREGLEAYWEWYYEQVMQYEDQLIVIGPHQLPVKINEGNYEKI